MAPQPRLQTSFSRRFGANHISGPQTAWATAQSFLYSARPKSMLNIIYSAAEDKKEVRPQTAYSHHRSIPQGRSQDRGESLMCNSAAQRHVYSTYKLVGPKNNLMDSLLHEELHRKDAHFFLPHATYKDLRHHAIRSTVLKVKFGMCPWIKQKLGHG